jgi:hypothetical protein
MVDDAGDGASCADALYGRARGERGTGELAAPD